MPCQIPQNKERVYSAWPIHLPDFHGYPGKCRHKCNQRHSYSLPCFVRLTGLDRDNLGRTISQTCRCITSRRHKQPHRDSRSQLKQHSALFADALGCFVYIYPASSTRNTAVTGQLAFKKLKMKYTFAASLALVVIAVRALPVPDPGIVVRTKGQLGLYAATS